MQTCGCMLAMANVLQCGGEANASQLWRMSGCWRTGCRIEIAAGVQMHGWLRCGQVDASVLRHLTLTASGGARQRFPECSGLVSGGAAACGGGMRQGGGKREEARCDGRTRAAASRRAWRRLQACGDEVAASVRRRAEVRGEAAAGVWPCAEVRCGEACVRTSAWVCAGAHTRVRACVRVRACTLARGLGVCGPRLQVHASGYMR